jgi:hypothetical protein
MTKTGALVLVLLIAGCGSGGSVSGAPVPREKYAEESYKAICDLYASCGIAKSSATCFQYYQALLGAYSSITTDFYAKSIELGKIKYDAVAAGRCLKGYATAACSLTALFTPAEDCRNIYVGQVPIGSSCGFGSCVPSAYCTSDVEMTCPGTCKARVEAGGAVKSPVECVVGLVVISGVCSQPTQLGSSCGTSAGFISTCAPGLLCSADTKTCVKPGVKGDTCTATKTCDIFYSCVDGVCASPGDVGATCGTNAGTCKLELFCNPTTSKCAERLTEGSVCTSAECAFGLRCSKATANATNNTCHKPIALNGACTTATAAECDSGLFCSSGSQTCIKQLAEGTACTTSDVCNFGTCTMNKCVSYFSSICI